VAVQRPDPDAGAGRDGLECHVLAFLGEGFCGGGQQLVAVALRVGAQRAGRGLGGHLCKSGGSSSYPRSKSEEAARADLQTGGVVADDQHPVREVTDSRGATVPDVPSTETSRIHIPRIPRPSRIGKSIDSRRDDGDSIPVQLALEAAAA
jgi:hypothetical protein